MSALTWEARSVPKAGELQGGRHAPLVGKLAAPWAYALHFNEYCRLQVIAFFLPRLQLQAMPDAQIM